MIATEFPNSKDMDTKSPDAWASIGVKELLHADPRPTFVIDDQRPRVQALAVLYKNPAYLRRFGAGKIEDRSSMFTEETLQKSILDQAKDTQSFISVGYHWTTTLLHDHWLVVSGNCCGSVGYDSPDSPSPKHNGHAHAKSKSSGHEVDQLVLMRRSYKVNDWTGSQAPLEISPWCLFLRSWDWSPTPFGPMSLWSPELRVMANLVCTNPNPAVLWWGDKMASLYNEHYVRLLSTKHPEALGQPHRETWQEIYAIPETAAVLNEVWSRCADGIGTKQDFVTYFLLRDSKLEEHIFHLTMIPVFGRNGETAGIFQHVSDVTQEQVRDRRLSTLISMADLTAGEEELHAFFTRVLESLRSNSYDIPFAILYSVGRPVEDHDDQARRGPNSMYLEGFLGIPRDANGVAAVHQTLIKDDQFLKLVDQAITSSDLVMFNLEKRPDLQQFLNEQPHTRGFGDVPEGAVLCPFEPRASKGVSGVLLMGLNTRRPYDQEYSSFFHTLSYSVSTSLASILQFQEQKQLAKAASERTVRALTSEQQAKAMLAVAPVGCFLMTLEGKMLYVNQKWMEITGYDLSEHFEKSWMSVIHEDEHPKIDIEWSRLVDKREPVSFELRLKKLWEAIDPANNRAISGPTYIIAAASPQVIEEVTYLTGCLTDISHQKYREGSEIRQRKEALELKRQQENFIDMTSHEMRNPLSAIFQCSDLIIAVLTSYREGSRRSKRLSTKPEQENTRGLDDPIATAVDAANTIMLCAQHQKRIVDDVLCLSKIDSKLIQITPVDVQPRAMIDNTLKMFNAELLANKTSMLLTVEKTFEDLQVDWVKLDPGRVLQVLINLCTNAIKFTVDSAVREIHVSLGASLAKPSTSISGVRYLQAHADPDQADPTTHEDWGQGEPVYLSLEVQDTGRGMSAEETKLLFQRFSQVARTHTKYGGSGLGLFIARLLTHLQGGEIGVSSTPLKGTTFAFYIKVRRLMPEAIPLPVPVVPDTNIVPAESSQVAVPPSQQLARRKVSEINILVVEDNLVNQKVLSRQLRTLGFHVSIANNGQEALDFLKTTRLWTQNKTDSRDLSLILMDIEMPVMTGMDATRRIRNFHADGQIQSHIPIIAITANARLEQIEAVRECGMDEVVSKPFRIPELLEKIEKFIGPAESAAQ